MTSPIERRALNHLYGLPEMREVMGSQIAKGKITYGHSIDYCDYTRAQMVSETAQEIADCLIYLEALDDTPPHVLVSVRSAAVYLNRLLKELKVSK